MTDSETLEQEPDLRPKFEDIKRTFVLYSNFRCGTNLFKSTLRHIGGIEGTREYFGRQPQPPGVKHFDEFLDSPNADLHGLLHNPNPHLLEYFGFLLAEVPPDCPFMIDLKYAQAYRLGVDGIDYSPVILRTLVNWGIPVIHLIRRDLLGQAISHLVALKTGKPIQLAWEKTSNGTDNAPPKADIWLDPGEVIRIARAREAALNTAWHHLQILKANHITVFYEDLVGQDWARHYQRCFAFLDHYVEMPEEYTPITVRQSSAKRVANLKEIMERVYVEAPELVYSNF